MPTNETPKPKHSPGPWTWEKPTSGQMMWLRSGDDVQGEDGEVISFAVDVLGREVSPDNAADARLIAATPEMLELLRDTLACLGLHPEQADRVRALLKRIDGDQP